MAETTNLPDFSMIGRELMKNAPRQVGVESEKFFRESFVKQGFTDTSFEPWKKSSSPLSGKRTLHSSGTLMRSIRVKEARTGRVIIESDTAYSDIHNEGGTITVTPKMKKYFWAKYTELTGSSKGSGKKKGVKVKESPKALFCKYMALMKVGSKIKIPKRQYMGHSQTLMRQLDENATQMIIREMKTLK